jgi:hypothetical protein
MRRRLILFASLMGLLALLTTACSSGGGSSVAPASTGDPATSTPSTAAAPAGTFDTTTGWRPWWIVGDTVTPGDVRPPTGGNDVEAALDALIAGPTPAEAAFGAGTGIAKGIVTLNSLVVGPDGIAVVDLSRKFETADTRPQTAQVVYTLTQFPPVKKVQFLIDGQPNGATGVPPVGRADLRFPAAPG